MIWGRNRQNRLHMAAEQHVKAEEDDKPCLSFQRFTSRLRSNLWSTYRPMQGQCAQPIHDFLYLFIYYTLLCACERISPVLLVIGHLRMCCCVAACLTQCTPSSKTKFTACLSLTLSRGMHFIFSHTRGSSSSSSFLWVPHERHRYVWWMRVLSVSVCPSPQCDSRAGWEFGLTSTCLPPPTGRCGHHGIC